MHVDFGIKAAIWAEVRTHMWRDSNTRNKEEEREEAGRETDRQTDRILRK